jgi:inositol transport system permease protein
MANESNTGTQAFSVKDWIKNNYRSFQSISILVVLIILMSIASPFFLSTRNLLNIVRQISMIATISFGVTIVIITAGIDLSSGSVAALAGVVAASFGLGGHSLFVAILLGLLAGAAAGMINGIVTSYGNIPPFIITLGMMLAARGAALMYTDGRPVTGLTDQFRFIGGGYVFGIPFPIFIMLFAALITHIIMTKTKFGRHVYAIGGNRQAAVVSGINVKRKLVWVYTYAGMLSGLAGIILAARLSAGQPTAAEGYELDAIAASVIGGTSFSGGVGTIPGVIIGALIIGVVNNGLVLLNVSPYVQMIVRGSIIVAAVLLDEWTRQK